MTSLKVSEIFGPTLQGEGKYIGMKVVFLRMAGCDYRCSWCDTPHALTVQQGKDMPVEAIITDIAGRTPYGNGHVDIVLTGGNPCLQPGIVDLLELCPQAWYFQVETQGSVVPKWINHWKIFHVVISPKLPSASVAQDPQTVYDFIAQVKFHITRASLKIVVFNGKDVDEAVRLYGRLRPQVSDFFLQVGTRPSDSTTRLLERYRKIAEYVLTRRDLGSVRVTPQMHVLLWGHRKGV